MGIIVRHPETNRYIFYLKGADSVMKRKVFSKQEVIVEDEADNLAREGLRTLVISQKYLSK